MIIVLSLVGAVCFVVVVGSIVIYFRCRERRQAKIPEGNRRSAREYDVLKANHSEEQQHPSLGRYSKKTLIYGYFLQSILMVTLPEALSPKTFEVLLL